MHRVFQSFITGFVMPPEPFAASPAQEASWRSVGRALAEAFHAGGNQVIIAGRRQHLLDAITAARPGMRGMQLDVEDASALDAFSNRVREQFPGLNVLINNAAISKPEDCFGTRPW